VFLASEYGMSLSRSGFPGILNFGAVKTYHLAGRKTDRNAQDGMHS